jgi:wyosine [tRNA(Phe)-imidazoG37] synthetase (radical SAM superfamily)
MKYVFGPVPSRRLGKSLGIDPIPLKTCNWNCVYCQLGRTAPLTMERGEYIPRHEILAEVEQALEALSPGEADWITFVGSGEPTLHAGLGWMIRQVKALTSLPVAVITNGSLLYLPEVRQELSAADAVLPTLDAGNDWLYRQINRAAPRFSFDRLIEGLRLFRNEYTGKLWIEVMLIRDMNDVEDALREIAVRLARLKPDQVHVTLPVRPSAEAGIRPSDAAGVARARSILSAVVPVSVPEATQAQAARLDDLSEVVLSIITRHPMQEEELVIVLNRWSVDEVRATIRSLADKKQILPKGQGGPVFWSVHSTGNGKKKEAE